MNFCIDCIHIRPAPRTSDPPANLTHIENARCAGETGPPIYNAITGLPIPGRQLPFCSAIRAQHDSCPFFNQAAGESEWRKEVNDHLTRTALARVTREVAE